MGQSKQSILKINASKFCIFVQTVSTNTEILLPTKHDFAILQHFPKNTDQGLEISEVFFFAFVFKALSGANTPTDKAKLSTGTNSFDELDESEQYPHNYVSY